MKRDKFDAIVVGSGASGSFAAKELTERGLDVALVEAGRAITPDDFKTDFAGPREKGIQLPARIKASLTGQPIQAKVAFYGAQQRHLFVNDAEHPYETPKDSPFLWIRGKQLGGRLHTYGRMLLRWSDYDFKAASRDGHGIDWPISYNDLAPYYDRVETFLGLYGCADGLRTPPDGKFVGPSKLTEAERDFKSRIESTWSDRHAVAWRYMPPNIHRIPQPILAARKTGRLTTLTDAVVRRVTTDLVSGLATGVEYVDRLTREVRTVTAGVVVVCASPIESVRLLLNSKSDRHPDGIGNGTGLLGRYFMDQVPSLIFGTVPGKTGFEADNTVPPDPFYGTTGGVYIPRFVNLDAGTNPAFARGFAYQGTIGRLFSRPDRPAKFGLMGFGEMLPSATNRVTLSTRRKDAWGVPVPHINCSMSGNETALLKEQVRAIEEMVRAAGLEVEFYMSALGMHEFGRGAFPDADWFSRLMFRLNYKQGVSMGAAIHESGGARMGSDPTNSVLNSNNQCWDAPNVYVTDASAFPSGGCAGTTLTIMALTVRACEHIASQRGS